MGHLCSCHRRTTFHNGAGGASTWKTDASLIHKIRLRCSYLGSAGGVTSTRPAGSLPHHDFPPLSNGEHPSFSEAHTAVDRTLPASSPSSPVPIRAATSAAPKPPRTRSMLVNSRDWTSELDLGITSGRDVTLSMSLGTIVVENGLDATSCRGGGRRHTTTGGTISALLRHTCDLLVSSGVRPELLVDFLRRRDVVVDGTAAAVRRCVARRAACELIAEVVTSKAEVSALCDGLQATGCGDVADCLAAVDSLLQLQRSYFASSESLSTIPADDRVFEEKSRDSVSCYTRSADEDQTGNNRLRSSVDVGVVYVDPSTGDTVTGDSTEDTSATRANCLRHRSLFVDPDAISLPPRPLGSVTSLSVNNTVVRLPVASATFHRVCLSDRFADRLADILLRHRSFRILTFVKCRRVDACLFRIRQTLVDRKCNAGCKLSRLDVRLSRVDDVNVVADLAKVLSLSLRSLSLNGCNIMSTGCAAVVRSLVAESRCLFELDLGFNEVTDVGPLSDALAANCSLRCLRLRGNAIGSVEAASLFCSLRQNYRLEVLDISGNPIGERQKCRPTGDDDLWRVLAEALLSNRTLRELKLERCSLGVEACSALGRGLEVNTTLRVLDISMNQSIGNLGATQLADGLRRNRRCRIHTLALNMCAVGNVGFRSLLIAIKDGGATGLRHVKLCYNHIGSKDQRQLAWQRSGSGLTDGGQDLSPRPRPASAHLELDFQEASRPLPVAVRRGGSTLAPGWRIGCNIEDVPSSMPTRQQGTSAGDRCPPSNTVMSQNLLVESANQNRQPVTRQNLVSSDCDARLVSNGGESDTTTSRTVFNEANQRPDLQSTPTTCRHLRTVVDGVFNWAAVDELPLPCDLSDVQRGRTELIRSASSVLGAAESRSSVDSRGVSPTSLDHSKLSTPARDEAGDVDDHKENIYVLLCRVLKANPQLKVLLWGNQQWHTGGGESSGTRELDDDVTEPAVNRSAVLCSMDESKSNRLDCSRTAYATLPRNSEFMHHFV